MKGTENLSFFYHLLLFRFVFFLSMQPVLKIVNYKYNLLRVELCVMCDKWILSVTKRDRDLSLA